jgi:hypothetical protein
MAKDRGGICSMRGESTKMGLGVKMACCGCHQAPAAVGTPLKRTRQVVSLAPAAFTGRTHMDGFGGRVHVEVRYTGKISEMPAAP